MPFRYRTVFSVCMHDKGVWCSYHMHSHAKSGVSLQGAISFNRLNLPGQCITTTRTRDVCYKKDQIASQSANWIRFACSDIGTVILLGKFFHVNAG